MRFLNLLATAAALLLSATSVSAQSSAGAAPTQSATTGSGEPLAIATIDGPVTAGSMVTIKWNPTTASTVSFVLRYGSSGALSTGPVIASDVPNTGTYSWTVSPDIPSGTYSIQITDSDGATNYSPFVDLTGGASSASASGSMSMSASASASSGMSSSTSGSSKTTSSKSTSSSSSKASTATATGATTQSVPSGAAGRVGAGTGFAAVVGLGALVAIV